MEIIYKLKYMQFLLSLILTHYTHFQIDLFLLFHPNLDKGVSYIFNTL